MPRTLSTRTQYEIEFALFLVAQFCEISQVRRAKNLDHHFLLAIRSHTTDIADANAEVRRHPNVTRDIRKPTIEFERPHILKFMRYFCKTLAAISFLSPTLSRSKPISRASAFVLGHNTHPTTIKRTPTTTQIARMSGWSSTWSDILNGGNPRWKITCGESHEKAYAHFQKHVLNGDIENNDDTKNLSVLCPLAGDDPFVRLLYRKGFSVTAIDLVAEAVEEMRKGFGDDGHDAWKKEESDGDVIWTHKSGRATLVVGDALKKRPKLNNSFDAVYDKDSFGALSKVLRKPFCERISEYTKDSAVVYLECKLKKGLVGVDNAGPPFSLRKEDLMDSDNYGGSKFEYVEGLGPVYELPGPMNAVMQQTGHVLRRTRK